MGKLFDPVVCYEVYSELFISSVFSSYRIESLYQQSQPFPSLYDVMSNFTERIIYKPLNLYIRHNFDNTTNNSHHIPNDNSNSNSNKSNQIDETDINDIESFPYETFVLQSILINRYIKIASGQLKSSSSGSISSVYVQNQVKWHLHDIALFLNTMINQNNFQTNYEKERLLWEVYAHIQMLIQKIAIMQPFIIDIQIPDGPPI